MDKVPSVIEDVDGLVFRHKGPLTLDPLGRDTERTRRLVDQVSPWRNRAINGNFVVNQGNYASGTALAAGAYGHDMWKAGSGGCTYTFSQLANSTTITITAGSLIQVIEDKMVEGGAYWLMWSGTAQARVGVNSATPSGSYSAGPIRWVNTAGTVTSIEFSTGTVGQVNVQPGRFPIMNFASRPYELELALCKRYYFRVSSNAGNTAYFCSMVGISTTGAFGPMPAIAGMRATPTVGYSALADITTYNGGFNAATALAASFPPEAPILTVTTASGLTAGGAVLCAVLSGTGKYVDFSARL